MQIIVQSPGPALLLFGSRGPSGKSAYQSYLDTTTDDPPMSEIAWAAGSNETTSSLLNKLKGAANDPARIGVEFLHPPRLFSGSDPNEITTLTLSNPGEPLIHGKALKFSGLFEDAKVWSESGKDPRLLDYPAGEVFLIALVGAETNITIQGNDTKRWASLAPNDQDNPWLDNPFLPQNSAVGNTTVTQGATEKLPAAFIGQECITLSARWRWNGTIWQPTHLSNGNTIYGSPGDYHSFRRASNGAPEFQPFTP